MYFYGVNPFVFNTKNFRVRSMYVHANIDVHEKSMFTIYRRHTIECLEGPNGESGLLNRKPALTPPQIKNWKHCHCPVWRSGSYHGSPFERVSLGVNSWAAAEAEIKKLMREKDGEIVSPTEKKTPLADAFERWHQTAVLEDLADSTLYQHKLIERTFGEFCAEKKCGFVSEIDTVLIEKWLVPLKQKYEYNTYRTRFINLRAFLTFCKAQKLLTEHPMENMKTPQIKRALTKEETMPLDLDGTETNYRKILEALDHINDNNKGVKRMRTLKKLHELRSSTKRLIAICKLMYETGLRISDAVLFNLGNVVADSECASYTFVPFKVRKHQRTFTTYFSAELHQEILALGTLTPNMPFWTGPAWDGRNEKLLDRHLKRHKMVVWTALQLAGERAGVPNVYPHRFRNSFAVNKLNAGARLEDVARWLGHAKSSTTEAFYSPWVRSREDASRRAYIRATAAKPENVVEIKPRKKRA
jgi:site-specific recombinase XerD